MMEQLYNVGAFLFRIKRIPLFIVDRFQGGLEIICEKVIERACSRRIALLDPFDGQLTGGFAPPSHSQAFGCIALVKFVNSL
jgi:hypothetical protein